MEEHKGMEARSIEYVLGVEDCATMVYDILEEGKDLEQLKRSIQILLNDVTSIKSHRFLEENGLLP
jgi:hypothetical protein